MKILLRKIREEKELSLRQVEILTGVSKSVLFRIEQGMTDPGIGILEKIAKGLHIKITDLFDSRYK